MNAKMALHYMEEFHRVTTRRERIFTEDFLGANAIAMQALEKQIAKKPELEGDGYADATLVYDTWICPGCRREYELDYDEHKYCPECGQAIDWSEYVAEKTEEE